jgi:hypothetical protein
MPKSFELTQAQATFFATNHYKQKAGASRWCPTWVIDPRVTRYLAVWDVIMISALLYTAIVTTYQLSFHDLIDILGLRASEGPLGLFITNRVVDLLFILDLVLCFRLMYLDSRTGQWVSSAHRIAGHYVRGWFAIDFLSALPLDMLPWLIGNGYSTLGGVARTVRLVRFARLARIFKAQRILKRQLQEVCDTPIQTKPDRCFTMPRSPHTTPAHAMPPLRC